MRMDEMARFALGNLRKAKLRTFLTTLGVVIGIGALVSMVSFGTGMQRNVTESFLENDVFTSLEVLPRKINLDEAMRGHPSAMLEKAPGDTAVLDRAAVERIRALPGVAIAFPEHSFSVKVRFEGRETGSTARGLPAAMAAYKPFKRLGAGEFYAADGDSSVVLSPRLLRELKVRLVGEGEAAAATVEDSLKGIRPRKAADLVGRTVEIVTSVPDLGPLLGNPLAALAGPSAMRFKEHVTRLRVAGVLEPSAGFQGAAFSSGVLLPMATAEALPRFQFSSVWDLLSESAGKGTYGSVYVRVRRMEDMAAVRKSVDEMGFGVVSVADQLEEFKKGFLIFDTMLGAVGTIALIVAALGIINTMVMSILERTREIGIMKAVGAAESDIKGIFFVEAGTIGLFGGLFGLGLGWVVTRIADAVANFYMAKEGVPRVEFFYIPLWLILGAMAFSILVSLAAGMYPATRAAAVNPVEALRHD